MTRFLITNDDGIQAEGIQTLFQLVRDFGRPTVVAPSSPYSGCGHQTTTDRELHLEQLDDHQFQVVGTPADCTRLALVTLLKDIEWVLSGINDGGNLGVDTFMSGTVAAVREAAFLGRPAIAFSQYRRDRKVRDWGVSRRMAERILPMLLGRKLPVGGFWNVNFPDVEDPEEPEIVVCPLDPHPLAVKYRPGERGYHYAGSYQQRPREPGSDVDICFSGNIAVSLVQLGQSFASRNASEPADEG